MLQSVMPPVWSAASIWFSRSLRALRKNVLVCVNLLDERTERISIDLEKLSLLLGVPVIGTVAQDRRSRSRFLEGLDQLIANPPASPLQPVYSPAIEEAVSMLLPAGGCLAESAGIRLLPASALACPCGFWRACRCPKAPHLLRPIPWSNAWRRHGPCSVISASRRKEFMDRLVEGLMRTAESIARETVTFSRTGQSRLDRRLDRIFTSRLTGYPVMAGLLALIFWLTLTGANYPSALLSRLFFKIQEMLDLGLDMIGTPWWIHRPLIDGIYRVLAWVVSVMLPPMAIFFPLFTLLEDSGFLPRIAYNLDKPFMRCRACGKQALTMAMGFGCNAAGVVGCRIIDSPRERLIAMLTNSFAPCNGRFPTLTALITMFFAGAAGGLISSLSSALLLTLFVLLGIGALLCLLLALVPDCAKGDALLLYPRTSAPTGGLKWGRVLLRSLLDRTIFVLGRAACIAAPAGLLIWLMANIKPDGISLLAHCASLLDPLGRVLGMDGVILTAFLLGLPANEIVLPLILMAYLSQGTILEFDSLTQLKELLTANGWTWITALCTMVFSLMHWPCSTTLLTIKKESGSWKWTALAFFLPTAWGMGICFLLAAGARALF